MLYRKSLKIKGNVMGNRCAGNRIGNVIDFSIKIINGTCNVKFFRLGWGKTEPRNSPAVFFHPPHSSFFRKMSILLTGIFIIAVSAALHAGNVKHILVINSYSSADLWTRESMDGLCETVGSGALPVNFDIFELGLLSRPETAPAPEDVAALKKRLTERHWDLVIAENNGAADLFLSGKLNLREGTPLLMMNYHGKLPAERQKALNATGVTAPFLPYENARFGLALRPDIKKIILVSRTAFSSPILKQVYEQIPQELRDKIMVISGEKHTTDQLLKILSAQPEDALLLFNSWGVPQEKIPIDGYKILPEIRKVFPGLILGRFKSYIDLGSSGGCVASGVEHGQQAGALALRILRGEKASAIPFEKSGARLMFNAPDLAKYHIRSTDIPEGTELINVPPDFLQRHYVELIFTAAVLLVILLLSIASLLFRRMAQKKVTMIFKHLPFRIGIIDHAGRIRYSYRPDLPEDAAPQNATRLEQLSQQAATLFSAAIQEAFSSGKKVERDYEIDGTFRHVEFIRLPNNNPFHTNVVMWISCDQTEIRTMHRTASQIAERFRLTLESIGDGVIATDREENVTLWNPVAEKLTGVAQEEAIGRKLDEVFHLVSYPDGRRVETPLAKALQSNATVELANHTDLIDKNGNRRHIADSASPIHDEQGKITGVVLVFRDVTEEYRKRDRMRLHSIILKTIGKVAKFDYFRCDAAGQALDNFVDEAYWPQHNGQSIPPEEWLLPEYLKPFQEGWRRLLSEENPELFLHYAAGDPKHPRYFELRAVRSFNSDSRTWEIFGLIQDVTATREAEFLSRDNLNLLQSIMENLPGYIFVKNADDNFRYLLANRKFGEMVGLDSKKLPGRTDQEIFIRDEAAVRKFHNDDVELVASGKPLNTRETFTGRSGEHLVVQTIKSVITRSDGKRLLIGMGMDISKQYELELAQKRTIDELDNFSRNERIINQSLTRITLEPSMEKAINAMLRIIGENAGADRCYVFRYLDKECSKSSNDYEWVRDGIEPQIDLLKNQDMSPYQAWTTVLQRRQEIMIEDMDKPPINLEATARDILKPQGIQSLLVSGIWIDNRLYGFVGLDFVAKKQKFSENNVHMARNIANLFLLAWERFQQLERIADNVSLQKQIVDNITIPIVIIDLDYNMVTANPRAAADCGIPVRQLAGLKCCSVICRCPEPPEWCPVRLTLQDARMHTCEAEIAGRRKIITAQPLFDRRNQLMYVLKADIDVTEIQRQKLELQKAAEQAQAADRAKSYFLATMSHELRTPLNAVIGFSELLRQGNIPRQDHDTYLESIHFAGTALLNLINDVLDLSKLEAEQMEIHVSKVDVASLISEIASIFQLKAKEKNLTLTVERAGLRALYYVDNQRLRQVMLNLIGNAFKFTHSGGVSIHASFTAKTDETGTLCISVADTGIGISPENIKRIFDPFIQGDSTRGGRAYEGSGLGLAISQRLVEKMGGRLSVTSQPEQGSVFSIQLENIRFEGSREPAPEETVKASSVAANNCRILLVDDVPMNLKVLAAMLKKLHVDSDSVTSGPEALRYLRQRGTYDMILTDLWMPEMNGVDLTKRIREFPEFAAIPVLAVTADAQVMTELPEIFQGVLLKPVTLDLLRNTLRRYCRFEYTGEK